VNASLRPTQRLPGDFFWLLHINSSGIAELSFDNAGPPISYVSDGLQADIALPGVEYNGPGPDPFFNTAVKVPLAARYDWSSYPPRQLAPNGLMTWTEVVVGGHLDSRTAIGTDHAAQSADTTNTFIAGALIGLAGAALIAAIQEALHARIRRRKQAGSIETAGLG
jgi:hypothetical protein